ncbi:hypothetical protein Sru01_54400 [Sphaerisporangium rufum]|uniref:Uncharacterized protein n=1 Tax=Sphaerisporangium rufum TaxID=1381558 RepID=A0A919V3U1_9ACTN|nr:hypothetical protein [Sphaerisporangium rufum]GII80458.1 hypothetical protein Sru01_54400 [Sphaerisporangium rufum]
MRRLIATLLATGAAAVAVITVSAGPSAADGDSVRITGSSVVADNRDF